MRFLLFFATFMPFFVYGEFSFLEDLDNVRSRSLVISTEEARLDANSEFLTAKNMFLTPTLSASMGRQKLSPYQSSGSKTTYDYRKASLTWNLFNGFGDVHRRSAAEDKMDSQSLKVKDQTLQVELNSANIIFQHLYFIDVMQTTEDLVKLGKESQRVATEKYKRGQLALQEVLKSEVDRAQQEVRLRTLQIQNLDNQVQWKTLFNEMLHTKTWPISETQTVSPPIELKTPKILSLEKLTQSTQSLWQAARSAHWPKLDVTAEYQEFTLGPTNGQTLTSFIQLTIPLWDRYEITAQAASTQADFILTRNLEEQAKRELRAQREAFDERLNLSRQSLVAARISAEKSKRLYSDMLRGFQYGRMSMNDLLIEQNRLFQSRLNLSQSELDFHKIIVEGCVLSGRLVRDCLSF